MNGSSGQAVGGRPNVPRAGLPSTVSVHTPCHGPLSDVLSGTFTWTSTESSARRIARRLRHVSATYRGGDRMRRKHRPLLSAYRHGGPWVSLGGGYGFPWAGYGFFLDVFNPTVSQDPSSVYVTAARTARDAGGQSSAELMAQCCDGAGHVSLCALGCRAECNPREGQALGVR